MADHPIIEESAQDVGATQAYAGTVGTTAVSIPSSAGNQINECLIRCPSQTPNSVRLSYSFDAGTTFQVLAPGEFIIWEPRNALTQLKIKGSVAGVSYEVLLNTESP